MAILKWLYMTLGAVMIFLGTVLALGHENEPSLEAESSEDDGWEVISPGPTEEVLAKVNQAYLADVKPIFERKCLDCHGERPLPWYAALPVAKQIIEDDVREAKEHMDMSEDFPFKGHGNPKDDLEQLVKTLEQDTMPPWQYKLLNWNSSLSHSEKKVIHKWIQDSLIILNKEE